MIGRWLVLLLSLPLFASAAVIEGRVVADGVPLAGVQVEAHAGLDFSSAPLLLSAPTTIEGYYRLELPAGRYALFARDLKGGRFASCGRNPLAVKADTRLWAGLQTVPAVSARRQPGAESENASIEGRVLLDGKPLAGAVVSLYLDAADDFKGRGYRSAPATGADGFFAFDGLPASSYFLVARQREGGGRVGPVREGDSFGIFPGNPLATVAGQSAVVELHLARKIKESAASEAPAGGGGPLLRGTVVDKQGTPVAGVHVFAYRDRVIGHERPAAVSAPTGADGVFVVSFERPGIYYVGAREQYGDSPAPGELFGLYDASADHGLEVAASGEPAPLRIVVEPITLE